MRCTFVLDVDMHEPSVPDSEKPKLKSREAINRSSGELRKEYFMPSGTEYEHPDAWKFVNFGMANAADDECREHVKPMTAQARARLQLEYRATALGIHDEADRQLFFDGVIAGYESVNGKMAFLPGPNYATWKADRDAKEVVNKETDI